MWNAQAHVEIDLEMGKGIYGISSGVLISYGSAVTL